MLFVVILLVAIDGYSINAYILYWWLLMAIGGYYISGYWWLFSIKLS
jgi:hypothetical protein